MSENKQEVHCPVCSTAMHVAPVAQNIYECDQCGAVIALIFEEKKKKETNKILYQFVAHFETDGDYGIRVDNIAEAYRSHIEKEQNTYDISLETYDIYFISRFLEQLMVSFNVCPSHYWLVPELYSLIYKVRNALFDENTDKAYETYGGNYDGTEIVLNKIQGQVLRQL